MFPYRINIEWSDEDGVYVARVPALPGVAAHGSTSAQAAREAEAASQAILAEMRADKERIPEPDVVGGSFSGNIRLRLPRSLHRQLAERAADEGVSLNQVMTTLLAAGAAAPSRRFAKARAVKKAAG